MRHHAAMALLGCLTLGLAACGQTPPNPKTPEEIKSFCSDPHLQRKLAAISDEQARQALSDLCFRSGNYTPSKPKSW
ncbi:entry exclusion lipoprotein TrbK [Dyella tabacisoli]|uniref:Entry exclusion lipoprotein TrbK n=1 Tax=Dyella tabacisoli TaxID=2282381 RepID=A0A369UR98_9GAMM|nr:entry exclusion lipoprotein TrbK [Dyella tabacisoli]RDD83041.1 entry exclusion lipoprotein TrbK [Dyella tabacisoli]